MRLVFVSAVLIASVAFAAAQNQTVCTGNCDDVQCNFTVTVNLDAGELGYFTFDECDGPSPTLGIEIGKTYLFNQANRTNYYHPMGFSFYPDGANNPNASLQVELEPGVEPPNSNSACASTLTCPAPMYMVNGKYIGIYSNNDLVANVTTEESDFGLDAYEPLFFHPLDQWAGQNFSIHLKFDVTTFPSDFFYFCHIHHGMSGRIKLLQNGTVVNPTEQEPEIEYAYDVPSEFDQECGTFGLGDYQLPNAECLERFVCNVDQSNAELIKFSKCIDAMNCHMMAGMTTNAMEDEIALFIHQMIPHHQNAVNMAKALLKTGKVQCEDLTVESPGCAMELILREIVNNQNFQVQTMRQVLTDLNLPQADDCSVPVFFPSSSDVQNQAAEGTSSAFLIGHSVASTVVGFVILPMAMFFHAAL